MEAFTHTPQMLFEGHGSRGIPTVIRISILIGICFGMLVLRDSF